MKLKKFTYIVSVSLVVALVGMFLLLSTPKYTYANIGEVVRGVFMVGDLSEPLHVADASSTTLNTYGFHNMCVVVKPGCESAFAKRYSAENYFDPILETLTPEEETCLAEGCEKTQLEVYDQLPVVSQRVQLTGDHLTQIAEVYVDTNGVADNLVLWIEDGFIFGSAENRAFGFPGKVTVKAQKEEDSFKLVEVYYGQIPLGQDYVDSINSMIQSQLRQRIFRLKMDYRLVEITDDAVVLDVTAPEGMITQENGELRLHNDVVSRVLELTYFSDGFSQK